MYGLPDIRAIGIATIDELPECLPQSRQYYSMLLAWDAPAELSHGAINALRKLVDRGLIYFCAWGANCERVHDVVDRFDAGRLKTIGDKDYFIMTTWHADESLAEAMWSFRYCVCPAESVKAHSYDRFAVSIGRPDWHQGMTKCFRRKRPGKK